ncbi:MAG: MOSC N-terminal beta barrel domain-containing protein [Rubrivivax sp.]
MDDAPLIVAELWRYPVKSLLGERLTSLDLVADGIVGDRMWGIQDGADGRILTGRREPRLLFASSRLGADGQPVVVLPDGRQLHGPGPGTDRALTAWLGKPVSLVSAAASQPLRAEYFADATDDASRALEWTMPEGRFVDSFPLLLLTTAALAGCAQLYPAGAWDVRRFRPNLLIDAPGQGWVEDGWAERPLAVGSTRLLPRKRCVRCTMVSRAQPGMDRDVAIYKTLHQSHGGEAGMWTQVLQPGVIAQGDRVTVG